MVNEHEFDSMVWPWRPGDAGLHDRRAEYLARDLRPRLWKNAMKTIDDLVKQEWHPGISAGAAARQLCRSLAADSALKLLLEAMLADANESAQDRTIILNEIMEFDLDFGKQLKLASFNRINHRDRIQHS